MDLDGAGNASRGLAALVTALAGLRESLRRPGRVEVLSRAEALEIVETLQQLSELTLASLTKITQFLEQVGPIAERSDRVVLLLADLAEPDLTKNQRRRLKKARKLRRYDTDDDAG